MSIITNVFTDRRERAFAIGVWGGGFGISMGLGPLVGGLLIESVGWRGIFWINVPIGAAAFVLAALFVPESRAPRPRRPDPLGQLFVVVTLAALTYAIIEAPDRGWVTPVTVGLVAVSIASAVLLVAYERRRDDPLIDPRFFHSIPFSGATVSAVCAFGGFAGFLFLTTLYLQDVRGYSAMVAGVCTLPLAVGVVIFAPLSGRIVGTRGPRLPLLVAGVLIALGAGMLVGVGAGTSMWWVIASYSVFAVGFGLVNAPITNTAVSGMPNSQAGVAAAIASTSRQVGATLGVAVAGSVLNTGLDGRSLVSGFVDASAEAWWIVAGCGVALFVLGLVTSGRWARSTAQATAHLFDEDAKLVAA
jgi:EmrB/QacA subfamily drug resistance transporter